MNCFAVLRLITAHLISLSRLVSVARSQGRERAPLFHFTRQDPGSVGKTSGSPGGKGGPVRAHGPVQEEKHRGRKSLPSCRHVHTQKMFRLKPLIMSVMSLQLQNEVQRLEVLKMQSMKSVVEAIRGEIKEFWAKCFYSQEQQEAFTSYHSGK